MKNTHEYEALAQIVRMRALQLYKEYGVVGAAKRLGISRGALQGLCGDLGVRRGTILTAAAALGLPVNPPTVEAMSFLPAATDLGR